jgi:hypothetical protein
LLLFAIRELIPLQTALSIGGICVNDFFAFAPKRREVLRIARRLRIAFPFAKAAFRRSFAERKATLKTPRCLSVELSNRMSMVEFDVCDGPLLSLV